ncbi:MAG: hypothetical protein ACTHNM_16035 [Dyella sp.]|uniref:hypothetical protein n=1 Tax=Dyella sp. TaxID=1869338 RepID=UPI003F7FCF8F
MNEQAIIDAFAKGERLHERIAKGMRHTLNGSAVITEDYDWLLALAKLERTAKRLASTDESVVTIIRQRQRQRVAYKLTGLGQAIRNLVVNTVPLVERDGSGFILKGNTFRKADGTIAGFIPGEPFTITRAILNPRISVMLRACMRIAHRLSGHLAVEMADVNEQRFREAYEHAARFVRRVCKSRRFKTILQNHQRSANKNLKSCLDYVTSLFEKHSKLLVMRVDLYIHPEHREWSASAHAEHCVGQFLRALREGRIIDPDVQGWIVKREGGLYRGIHFHLMVFLDGHKHQDGYVYSQLLGEAWMRRFSDGKGTYFNCWVLRKKYEYNALGVVHVSDWTMLTGITVALEYVTKEDCALETGRSRNLRRGILVRFAGSPKLGAPRKAENDLSLVKQVLTCSHLQRLQHGLAKGS